jgi:hypothetical protein
MKMRNVFLALAAVFGFSGVSNAGTYNPGAEIIVVENKTGNSFHLEFSVGDAAYSVNAAVGPYETKILSGAGSQLAFEGSSYAIERVPPMFLMNMNHTHVFPRVSAVIEWDSGRGFLKSLWRDASFDSGDYRKLRHSFRFSAIENFNQTALVVEEETNVDLNFKYTRENVIKLDITKTLTDAEAFDRAEELR